MPFVFFAMSAWEAGEALYKTGAAYGFIDPVAFAQYRLYAASDRDFIAEVEEAIARRDYDYAESLSDLATRYGHELPPDLTERAKATPARRVYASGVNFAKGFFKGSVESGSAVAGAVVSDLVGVGDVRDFSVQGYRYMNGEEVDAFLFGLSAIGLGLTATTVASFGSTALPDAGIAIIKNTYRAGRISRPLTAYFAKNAAKAVDMKVLKTELKSVDGLGGINKAAAKSLNKGAARALTEDAAVLGKISGKGGVRASVLALEIADGPKDLRKLSRIAAHFGDGSVAVFKFLGRSVLRIGYWLAEFLYLAASLLLMIGYGLLRFITRFSLRGAVRRYPALAVLRYLS